MATVLRISDDYCKYYSVKYSLIFPLFLSFHDFYCWYLFFDDVHYFDRTFIWSSLVPLFGMEMYRLKCKFHLFEFKAKGRVHKLYSLVNVNHSGECFNLGANLLQNLMKNFKILKMNWTVQNLIKFNTKPSKRLLLNYRILEKFLTFLRHLQVCIFRCASYYHPLGFNRR